MKLSVFALVLFAAVGPMRLARWNWVRRRCRRRLRSLILITGTSIWHRPVGWRVFSGDIGLNGVSSNVNVDFDQILRQIDYAASVSLEARKGRFGFYSDLLYLEASDALYNNGILSKVNIALVNTWWNGEAFYRSWTALMRGSICGWVLAIQTFTAAPNYLGILA